MFKPLLPRSRRQFLVALGAGTASLVSTGLLTSRRASSRGIDNSIQWQPSNTWVFAIGVLTYPEGEAWPQAGRRDAAMVKALQRVGVPDQQIMFIKDQRASKKYIKQQFQTFLSKAPNNATLWFYFTGHGDKQDSGIGTFELYDGSWSNKSMVAAIEKYFKGESALLFADCCYSGSLCEYITRNPGRVAYAALGSSSASQESTGAWTFTNCLVTALQGKAFVDADKNAQISIAELASFAELEMAANDGQLSTFSTANGFNKNMVLRQGQPRRDPRVGSYVHASSSDGSQGLGRIEAINGDDFLLRWSSYDEAIKEWVKSSNTRPWNPKVYANGSKVLVLSEKKWYPAVVLNSKYGVHLIHYDDYESVWDEWVSPERIKPVRG